MTEASNPLPSKHKAAWFFIDKRLQDKPLGYEITNIEKLLMGRGQVRCVAMQA